MQEKESSEVKSSVSTFAVPYYEIAYEKFFQFGLFGSQVRIFNDLDGFGEDLGMILP